MCDFRPALPVLNELGIDRGNIEVVGIEPYWKIEGSYDVSVCCDVKEIPEEERLLNIADIWLKKPLGALSSWSIPNNKMRYQLVFINIQGD